MPSPSLDLKVPNNDDDGCQNEVRSGLVKHYRSYFISFILSNVGNDFWSLILKLCTEGQEKKDRESPCLVFKSPTNVTLGIFTSWSCSDGKEMLKKA